MNTYRVSDYEWSAWYFWIFNRNHETKIASNKSARGIETVSDREKVHEINVAEHKILYEILLDDIFPFLHTLALRAARRTT